MYHCDGAHRATRRASRHPLRSVERLAAGLVDGVGESAVGDFQKAPGDEDRGDDEEE